MRKASLKDKVDCSNSYVDILTDISRVNVISTKKDR